MLACYGVRINVIHEVMLCFSSGKETIRGNLLIYVEIPFISVQTYLIQFTDIPTTNQRYL